MSKPDNHRGNSNGHSELATTGTAADQPPATLTDAEVQVILQDGEPPLVDVDALDYTRRLTYERQERLLEGYVRYGTILKAAEFAEVHYDCHYQWRKKDTLSWNERWQRAVDRRREFAEQKYVLDRLDSPSGNRGGDILAIAYMNRINPEHWNRNLKLTHDVPNELIQRLRELQALGNKPLDETQGAEPKVIEGESKVMPWD